MSLLRYVSHKEVEAMKITEVIPIQPPVFSKPTCRGSFALGSACNHCGRCEWERTAGPKLGTALIGANAYGDSVFIKVSAEFVAKHQPTVGGYYVRYQDGYESFSPAEAFENGYTLKTA